LSAYTLFSTTYGFVNARKRMKRGMNVEAEVSPGSYPDHRGARRLGLLLLRRALPPQLCDTALQRGGRAAEGGPGDADGNEDARDAAGIKIV